MRDDTNVGLRLLDGMLIEVIYPERIGHEYETPWLGERVGSREWNVDPAEILKREGRVNQHRLIVGKWGTVYGSSDGVKFVVPLNKLVAVETLPEEKVAIGEDNERKEALEFQERAQNDPERYVHLRELRALEERVVALERK